MIVALTISEYVSVRWVFSFMCRDYLSVVPTISLVNPIGVQQGSSLTLQGAHFGSNVVNLLRYSDPVVSLYGTISQFAPASLRCAVDINTLNDGSVTCTVPPGSGGASSFSVQYGVCVTAVIPNNATLTTLKNNGVITSLCVFSSASNLSFSYAPPTLSVNNVPTTPSPSSVAGGPGFLREPDILLSSFGA